MVIWGVALAAANYFAPYDWFWVVFIIQVINISGAAGDIYVACRLLSVRGEVLVKDSGTAMELYIKDSGPKLEK